MAGSTSSWQTSAMITALGCLPIASEVAEREAEAEPEHDDAEGNGQSDGGQR